MYVCCIIKPPAVSRCVEISTVLLGKGVTVRCAKTILFTAELVDQLYDHMDDEARAAIVRKYGGRIGVALCMEVENIAAGVRVIGTESNPSACHEESIRALFGVHESAERIGAWEWWENALHRPVDERERVRDLRLLFPEWAEGAG